MIKVKSLFFALIALIVTTSVTSCIFEEDNEDIKKSFETLPFEVQEAFSNKFPDASYDDWYKSDVYYVICFVMNNTHATAWFFNTEWKMTETRIKYEELPSMVVESFKSGDYSDWHVDDIDKVERLSMNTMYVLQVGRKKMESDLFYLEDGTFLRAIANKDNENGSYIPMIPDEIKSSINRRYPGAVIFDMKYENGLYKVEIYHELKEYEVVLDAFYNWMYSKREIPSYELTPFVINYINNLYPGYEIFNSELWISSVQGVYYEIDIRKGDSKFLLKITPEGKILK